MGACQMSSNERDTPPGKPVASSTANADAVFDHTQRQPLGKSSENGDRHSASIKRESCRFRLDELRRTGYVRQAGAALEFHLFRECRRQAETAQSERE